MQHVCMWNAEILNPIQRHGMAGPGQTAFKKLRILLERMMLRRTKVCFDLLYSENLIVLMFFRSLSVQTTLTSHLVLLSSDATTLARKRKSSICRYSRMRSASSRLLFLRVPFLTVSCHLRVILALANACSLIRLLQHLLSVRVPCCTKFID